MYVAIANFFALQIVQALMMQKQRLLKYQLKKQSFPKALSCIFGTENGVS